MSPTKLEMCKNWETSKVTVTEFHKETASRKNL